MNVNIVIIFIHVYIHNNYMGLSVPFCASGHQDIWIFRPCSCRLFIYFFFPDLGNHVAAKLGEPRTYTFLLQCVAIKGQRG